MNIKLNGKNALVCGASKGIGFAIAKQLAEMGANVTILSRSKDNLQKAIAVLPKYENQKHDFIFGDFITPEPIIDTINQKINNGTDYHILINNTGGPAPGLIHEAAAEDFIDAFKRHVIMSQLITQTLLPVMKKNNYGRILNIISISVKQPIENLGISNTIRGAMNSWSKTLSREIAQFGITVNNILPGFTRTERLESLFMNNASKTGISIEQYSDGIKDQIPAGRFSEPKELAYLIGFLASDKASYITGVNIQVDGGYIRGF